ncbi:MAG: homocysteine S-methyltransferase family protein [Planctomycetota bacterium]|jgi:5-methyltetrahydrofolate--homocysteine methyltransferase
MTRQNLKDKIASDLLILDGAMGTQLMARGIEPGTCNDYLNIGSPDIIADVHNAYLQAGSDAIITNTFGANKFTLARHGLSDKAVEINTAAANIARNAAGEDKYVLGDIGPTGDFLKPLGSLEPESLKDAFTEQAKTLTENGVDAIIIETMTALDELEVAINAVKDISDLPLFVSLSFDTVKDGFKTMMGVDPATAAGRILPLGVDALGFNCGLSTLQEYVQLTTEYAAIVREKAFLLAEPNAGKPELQDGQALYKVTPVEFALTAKKIHEAGACIIGGCCGTSPDHIKAAVQKIKQ